jgi:hypothetical protein
MAQAGWLPVLRTLGTLLYTSGRLQVAGAGKLFDANGALVDDTVRGLLETYMRGFSEFVSKHRRT